MRKKAIKLISLFSCLVLIMSIVCSAPFTVSAASFYSGTTGDCTWNYSDGTLTISGEGDMASYNINLKINYYNLYGDDVTTYAPYGVLKNYVTKIVIEEGVTSIGSVAFADLINVTSVEIPDTVTWIGSYAFMDNSKLDGVTIPSGVGTIREGTFKNCSSLTSIEIPEGQTEFYDYTFYNCRSLGKIDTPANLRSIGNYAFTYCTSMTQFDIPSGVKSIGNYAFYGCTSLYDVDIPASVTSFGESSFGNTAWWNSLPDGMIICNNCLLNIKGECPTELIIPEGVVRINGISSTNLKKLVIPSTVKDIGDYAFEECSNLTDLTITNGVESIGKGAFSYCTKLPSVVIPDSVTSMGSGAFGYCYRLESVTLSKNLVYLNSNIFRRCVDLKTVVIPKYVYNAYNSFRECYDLESVLLMNPDTTYSGSFTSAKIYRVDKSGDCDMNLNDGVLTIIGSGAMADYSEENPAVWDVFPTLKEEITTIVVEDGVTSIGDNAFKDFTNLTSVTLPDSVTRIGASAFENCTSLAVIPSFTNVNNMGEKALDNTAWLNSQPDGYVYAGNVFYNYKGECPATLTLKDGTTTVAGGACEGSETLERVEGGYSVKNLGVNAFCNCPNLTGAVFYNRDTDGVILSGALKNCPKLTVACINGSPVYSYASGNGIPCAFLGGETENCTWEVIGKKLILSGSGNTADYATANDVPWHYAASWITEIELGEEITGLGGHVFDGFTSLTTPPDTSRITYLGESVFENCTSLATAPNLSSVKMMGGLVLNNTAWLNSQPDGMVIKDGVFIIYKGECPSKLVIENGKVRVVARGAIATMPTLQELEIEEDVQYVNTAGFFQCYNLKRVTFYSPTIELADNAFQEIKMNNNDPKFICYPDSTAEAYAKANGIRYGDFTWGRLGGARFRIVRTKMNIFGSGAVMNFDNGSNPAIWTELPDAFEQFDDVTVEEGVTALGNYLFYTWTPLENVTLSSTVTRIGDHTFDGCTNLNTLPDLSNVNYVGEKAFYDTAWYNSQPDGMLYAGDVFLGYKGECPSEITIKEGTRVIAAGALRGCMNLTKVNLPSTVKYINDCAFEGCTSLTTVTGFGSVYSIGESIFENCTSLAEAPDLSGIKIMGGLVFNNTAWLNSQPDGMVIKDGVFVIYKGECPEKIVTEEGAIRVVAGGAIATQPTLKELDLAEDVEYINTAGFFQCYNLKKVYFCSLTTELADNAFQEIKMNNNDPTFVCIPGSPAEDYAKANGIKYQDFGNGHLGQYNIGGPATRLIRNKLYIDGEGESTDYGKENSWPVWRAFPEYFYFDEVIVQENVEGFGNCIFYNWEPLKKITLAPTVKKLGDYAFENCVNLNELPDMSNITYLGVDALNNTGWYNNQPDGLLYAGDIFIGCKGECPSEITLKEGTRLISAGALSGCTNLTKINLPSSLQYINNNAFEGCTSLTEVTGGVGLYSIGDSAFENCTSLVTVPDLSQIKYMGSLVFNNTAWLNSQPDGTVIKDGVFITYMGECPEKLLMSDGTVRVFAKGALKDQQTVTTLEVEETVEFINPAAVANCPNLKVVYFYSKTTEFADGAFEGFGASGNNARFVAYPDSTADIYAKANGITCYDFSTGNVGVQDVRFRIVRNIIYFYGEGDCYSYHKDSLRPTWYKYADQFDFDTLIVEEGVTSVGSCMFNDWGPMKNVILSSTVTKIGESAFENCANLTSVTIPESVTSIEDNAFSGCENVIFYGKKGSFAESYANENGIAFVALNDEPENAIGDINGDTVVDIFDSLAIQKFVVEKEELTEAQLLAADVNNDGTVDILDAADIQKFAVEKITEFKKKA